MSRLAGKVVVVTGTSPNIGGGIAEGLADEGARVVCVDIDADDAMQCAESIVRRGGDALGIVCDVTDEAQVEAMVARAREAYGGVDVLVNNAGILGGLSVLEMPLERWNRQIGVNLTGTFLCTKHVARLMVEQGRRGSIIVVVSTAGHQGQAGNIAYSTSKSGLLELHARRGHGPGQARHPGEQPHADGHGHGGGPGARGGVGPPPAGRAGAACSTSRRWCRWGCCRARATTRAPSSSSPPTTPR